jgi:hypothetical protein
VTDLRQIRPATVSLLSGRRTSRCHCSHSSHTPRMRLLQLPCNLLGGAQGAWQCLLDRSGRHDAPSDGLHARLLLRLCLLLTWIGCCSLFLWFVCDCSIPWRCSRIPRTLHFFAARMTCFPHSMRTMMLHLAELTPTELARRLVSAGPCRSWRHVAPRGTYPQRCAGHRSTGSARFPLGQSWTSFVSATDRQRQGWADLTDRSLQQRRQRRRDQQQWSRQRSPRAACWCAQRAV